MAVDAPRDRSRVRLEVLAARLARFTGVGAVATLVHVAVALVTAPVMGDPRLANLAGFCAAFAVSYLGHFHMTFRLGAEPGARHDVHLARFLAVSLLSLGLSSGLVAWLTVGIGLSFALTMGVVAGTVATVNCALSNLWAFRPARMAQGAADLAGTAIAGLVAALFLAVLIGHPVNHDTAWYLVATRSWLEGGTLYLDVVEINPPLAFYLTVPAIVLSDLTGLDATTAFYLTIGAAIFSATRWTWAILGDAPSLTPGRRAAITALVGLALFVPALDEIGQREHIMTILAAPWLIAWLVHPGGGSGRGAVLRAGVAALGLCLKPHFIMIPFALTLTEMIRTRALRPCVSVSNLTLAALGAAYVGFVALVHPAYFETVVPVALAVYEAYTYSTLVKLLSLQPVLVATFALLAAAAWRSGGRSLRVAVALVAGAVASYVLQNKGFTYHALPVATFASIGAIWMLVPSATPRAVKLLSICVLVLVVHDTLRDGRYRNTATEILLPEVRELLAGAGPNRSILVLSSGLGIAFPLVLEAEAQWASRYPALWFLPGAVQGLEGTDCAAEPERCATLRDILERSLITTIEDIETAAPALIIVDPFHHGSSTTEIDHLGLLRATAGGAEALAPYREVGGVGAVRILQRQPG